MSITSSQAQALAAAYAAAWNAGDPAQVAAFFAETGQIIINRGTPWLNRDGVRDMAAGFYADVPDIEVICDGLRLAGDHMAFLWTFTGHHAGTKAPLNVVGWEEWDLDASQKVTLSRGWYDAEDYARQVKGG